MLNYWNGRRFKEFAILESFPAFPAFPEHFTLCDFTSKNKYVDISVFLAFILCYVQDPDLSMLSKVASSFSR